METFICAISVALYVLDLTIKSDIRAIEFCLKSLLAIVWAACWVLWRRGLSFRLAWICLGTALVEGYLMLRAHDNAASNRRPSVFVGFAIVFVFRSTSRIFKYGAELKLAWMKIRKISTFVELVPLKDRKSQFWFAVRIICCFGNCILRFWIPRQISVFMESLSAENSSSSLKIWALLEITLKLGSFSLTEFATANNVYFWARKIQVTTLQHTLSLPLDINPPPDLPKRKSPVHKAEMVARLFDSFLFRLLPPLVELVVAYIIIWSKFGLLISLITLLGCLLYINFDTTTAEESAKEDLMIVAAGEKHERATSLALTHPLLMNAYNAVSYHCAIFENSLIEWHEVSCNHHAAQIFKVLYHKPILELSFFWVMMMLHQLGASGEDITFFTFFWGATIARVLPVLGGQFKGVVKLCLQFNDFYKILEKPIIKDRKDARPLSTGQIVFKNVKFSYGEKALLKGINFTTKPGQFVALMGLSGSGKSTILKLLTRLYNPLSGLIEISGVDIMDITLDSLRKAIAFAPSRDDLFDELSIMENLQYPQLDSEQGIADGAIFEACRRSMIHKSICALPNGYKTIIGSLSDGQRRRVGVARAIARVIAKGASILVLDEPTSSLDPETAANILRQLQQLDCTVIISVTQVETAQYAEKILVLDDGTIDEFGSHYDLISKKGRYWDFCQQGSKAERISSMNI
ncbi:hypothetical protein N7540_013219 [Penicillium herquei]|nr:hypothetical protein N7540_013219 [Penicillium herquei]